MAKFTKKHCIILAIVGVIMVCAISVGVILLKSNRNTDDSAETDRKYSDDGTEDEWWGDQNKDVVDKGDYDYNNTDNTWGTDESDSGGTYDDQYGSWYDDSYECIITFVSNGGSAVGPKKVYIGDYIDSLEIPARENYIFEGWYEDEALTTPFFALMPVYSNYTLFAKWSIDIAATVPEGMHKVVFDRNDGSGEVYDMVFVADNTAVAEPSEPTLPLYRCTGWYREPALLTEYDFSQPVTDDIILYAGWGAPDGNDDMIYSVYEDDGTEEMVDAILGLRCERGGYGQGSGVYVTVNANEACTLMVEILDEDTYWENDDVGSAYEMTYGMTSVSHRCVGSEVYCSPENFDYLPQHFVVRARLLNEQWEDLCVPFYSIEYTTAYERFASRTIEDLIAQYGAERVVMFDETGENYGVFSENVIRIDSDATRNCLTVFATDIPGQLIPEQSYVFENPDSSVTSLKEGDTVFAYAKDGVGQIFRIGTIEQDGNAILFTSAGDAVMTDFYTVLKVDMTMGESDVENAEIRQASNETRDTSVMKLAYVEADDNPYDADGQKPHAINVNVGNAIKVTFIKAGTEEIYFSGSVGATLSLEWKIMFDAELFRQNYLFVSAYEKLKIEPVLSLHGEGEFIKKEVEGPKIPLSSPVGIGYVYQQITVPIEGKLTGDIGYIGSFYTECGVIYDSRTGIQNIGGKRKNTHQFNVEAEAECSIGPKVKCAYAFGDIVSLIAGKSDPAFKFETSIGGGVSVSATISKTLLELGAEPEGEEVKHACTACLDVYTELYIRADVELDFLFKGIEANLFLISAPIKFRNGKDPGHLYVSLINDKDSIFGGKLHWGVDECPNQKWRVIVKAQKNDQELKNVDFSVIDSKKVSCGSGRTEGIVYLPNGHYAVSGNIEGRAASVEFDVEDSPSEVVLGLEKGTLFCKVKDADTHLALPDADIEVLQDGVVVATGKTDANGGFSHVLPRGTYTIKAVKNTYGMQNASVEINDGEYEEIALQLSPAKTRIAGIVKNDTTGSPIAGATVRVLFNGKVVETKQTDSDGSYDITLKPSDTADTVKYLVSVSKEDYVTSNRYLKIKPKTTLENDVNLIPGGGYGSLRGSVSTWFGTSFQETKYYDDFIIAIRKGWNADDAGQTYTNPPEKAIGNFSNLYDYYYWMYETYIKEKIDKGEYYGDIDFFNPDSWDGGDTIHELYESYPAERYGKDASKLLSFDSDAVSGGLVYYNLGSSSGRCEFVVGRKNVEGGLHAIDGLEAGEYTLTIYYCGDDYYYNNYMGDEDGKYIVHDDEIVYGVSAMRSVNITIYPDKETYVPEIQIYPYYVPEYLVVWDYDDASGGNEADVYSADVFISDGSFNGMSYPDDTAPDDVENAWGWQIFSHKGEICINGMDSTEYHDLYSAKEDFYEYRYTSGATEFCLNTDRQNPLYVYAEVVFYKYGDDICTKRVRVSPAMLGLWYSGLSLNDGVLYINRACLYDSSCNDWGIGMDGSINYYSPEGEFVLAGQEGYYTKYYNLYAFVNGIIYDCYTVTDEPDLSYAEHLVDSY